MSALNLWYPALRIMLGDYDPAVQQYPDSVLLSALQTMVQLGKLPPPYMLTPDGLCITPDFPPAPVQAAANLYALVTYHTVKLFVQNRPNRYSFRSRPFSENFGSWDKFLQTIEMDIHLLENGHAFSGWQSYFAWLHGVAGLPLGEVLAGFDLEAPLWRATFTRDGMRVM